jgi:hypothetical protein
MSAMQDLNVCTEKTSSELVKVMIENVTSEMEFSKVKKECDEIMQKVERMQHEFEKVYQEFP